MHLGMVEYHILFSGHCDLDLVLIIIVSGASLIFFEIGIPNLVCICILGWWSVTYFFRVTVTLTSDLF